MKKVFICSPYAGETMRNVVLARQHCLHAISLGFAPFAPHLLYPQFLSDELAEDRKAGIDCGIEFLKCCDMVMVFGDISAGMRQEITIAEKMGKEIRYIGGEND